MDGWLRAGSLLGVLLVGGGAGFFGGAAYRETHPRHLISSALGCVDTIVSSSSEPTNSTMAGGGWIAFRADIAPGHGTPKEAITGVYVGPEQHAVANAGDQVRVCLLSVPTKDDRCDPLVDPRGREFLVYDVATRQAETYYDGEHLCGGA